MKMHLKISSAKRRPFCFDGFNTVLVYLADTLHLQHLYTSDVFISNISLCLYWRQFVTKNHHHWFTLHWIFDGRHIRCVITAQWASYQMRKLAGCACAGNTGNVSPRRRFQQKPLVSNPGMHHGTCVTHVPWCMSGSLTCGDGENVPGIPGACAPAILRIWQDAHKEACQGYYCFSDAKQIWVCLVSLSTWILIIRVIFVHLLAVII